MLPSGSGKPNTSAATRKLLLSCDLNSKLSSKKILVTFKLLSLTSGASLGGTLNTS